MSDARYISWALAALLLPLCALVHGQAVAEPLSDMCLGCICEAASSCDRSLQCDDDVCGIFRITWAYWFDAGTPLLTQDDHQDDAHAYDRCVNDPVCASKTVTGYMNRFAQDCNNDGKIDCVDYVKIHRLGAYGCHGQLDQAYKERFNNCYQQVQQFRTPGSG